MDHRVTKIRWFCYNSFAVVGSPKKNVNNNDIMLCTLPGKTYKYHSVLETCNQISQNNI